MRPIKYIVLHCTASTQDWTVEQILAYFRDTLKWRTPGYHTIVEPDGEVRDVHPHTAVANGVAGYNANAIHVSWIGGIDAKRRTRTGLPVPVDNRTEAQRATLKRLVQELQRRYPDAQVLGHRNFPGVAKACPSFDVVPWLRAEGLFRPGIDDRRVPARRK